MTTQPKQEDDGSLAHLCPGKQFGERAQSGGRELPSALGEDAVRVRLFGKLGIREPWRWTHSPTDEQLIAWLCHEDERTRREAAFTLADRYADLTEEMQIRARVHLVLMLWCDVSLYARIVAARVLAALEAADVSVALQGALRDESQDVRAAAACALGPMKESASGAALVVAARDLCWHVRVSAIQAMGQKRERSCLNAICAALDDKDASVRGAALCAYTRIEGLLAAPRLVLVAQRDRNILVKEAAVRALEWLVES